MTVEVIIDTAYGEDFFAEHHGGARSSAQRIVPLVVDFLHPRSAIDVGCGTGTWLAVFQQHGVSDVFGIDGDYVRQETLEIEARCFSAHDLREPLSVGRRFDLAICLEVAEHLPIECADEFVLSLTSLAPFVLFSAAIPNQGGTSHVNEQWPEFWAERFSRSGYVPVDVIRPLVWDDPAVEVWYAQNTLLYAEEAVLSNYPQLMSLRSVMADMPLSRVHPRLYGEVADKYAKAYEAYSAYRLEAERCGRERDEHRAKVEHYVQESAEYRAKAEHYMQEAADHRAKAEHYVQEAAEYHTKADYFYAETERFRHLAEPRNMHLGAFLAAAPRVFLGALRRGIDALRRPS